MDNEELGEKILELEEQIDELQIENREYEEEVTDLQKENDSLEDELGSYEEENLDLRREIDELTLELEVANGEQEGDCYKILALLTKEYQRLEYSDREETINNIFNVLEIVSKAIRYDGCINEYMAKQILE